MDLVLLLHKTKKRGFHYIDNQRKLYIPAEHAPAAKKLSLLDLEKKADEKINYKIKLSDKLIREGWLFDTQQAGNPKHKYPGKAGTCSFEYSKGIKLIKVAYPEKEIYFECGETKKDRTAYDLHLVHTAVVRGIEFKTSIIIDPIIRNGT